MAVTIRIQHHFLKQPQTPVSLLNALFYSTNVRSFFRFPLHLRTLLFDTSKLLQCVLTSNFNIYIQYLSVSPQVSFGFRCFRRIFVSSYRCHINSVWCTAAKTQTYAPTYRIFYFKRMINSVYHIEVQFFCVSLLIIFTSIKRTACV